MPASASATSMSVLSIVRRGPIPPRNRPALRATQRHPVERASANSADPRKRVNGVRRSWATLSSDSRMPRINAWFFSSMRLKDRASSSSSSLDSRTGTRWSRLPGIDDGPGGGHDLADRLHGAMGEERAPDEPEQINRGHHRDKRSAKGLEQRLASCWRCGPLPDRRTVKQVALTNDQIPFLVLGNAHPAVPNWNGPSSSLLSTSIQSGGTRRKKTVLNGLITPDEKRLLIAVASALIDPGFQGAECRPPDRPRRILSDALR